MPEPVAQLIDALLRAWNAHDAEGAAALCAAHYEGLDVGEAAPRRGPEGMRQTMLNYDRAFPDLRIQAEAPIVEGNRAAFAWTAHGTHRGPFMNIPPTGRAITVRGVAVLTIEEGRLAQGLYIWDVAGMLRAIGLLPELRAA